MSVNLPALEKAFNGDKDLVTFFISWIKHNKNATEAYLELNPKVDRASAQVQGSRILSKIDVKDVMKCYGLGVEEYFNQLNEGHQAMKWNDFTGEREPDHKVRGDYSKRIGKLLGIEKEEGSVNIQGEKILVIPSELMEKYAITSSAENSSSR